MGGSVHISTGFVEKRCSQCRIVKPLNEFYVNRAKRDGRSTACKVCLYGVRKPLVRENLHNAYTPVTESGCWIWQMATDSNGYGVMQDDDGRLIRAHVKFYLLQHGSMPEGTEIDHLCRVRCCVNPSHLEAVPHRVNSQRGMAGQHMKTRKDFGFLKRVCRTK